MNAQTPSSDTGLGTVVILHTYPHRRRRLVIHAALHGLALGAAMSPWLMYGLTLTALAIFATAVVLFIAMTASTGQRRPTQRPTANSIKEPTQ